jgi:hypothetical protein
MNYLKNIKAVGEIWCCSFGGKKIKPSSTKTPNNIRFSR